MRMKTGLLPLAAVVCLASACSSEDLGLSRDYISWSESSIRDSTIMKAQAPTINVCLQGRASTADLDRAKLWTKQSLLTWLRTLKVVDQRVTSSLTLTCTDRHLTINLLSGSGRSYASPSVANLYLGVAYGTWTHELGHAFAGLSDTYTGSSAGACRSGQPESLMCWGAYGPRRDHAAWSTLWQDDIAGIQANFRRVFQGPFTAPDWAGSIDLEAPLDPQSPWPEAELAWSDGDNLVETIAGGLTPVDETLPAL